MGQGAWALTKGTKAHILITFLILEEQRPVISLVKKVTDIYATAMDYDKSSPITREFFAKVQNKMHFAVHGQTAAELVYDRADADREYMGLTTWALYPHGKILGSDVSIAKNYLTEAELKDLGPLVMNLQMLTKKPPRRLRTAPLQRGE